MPALIKILVEMDRINNKINRMQKIFKTGAIFWEKTQCVYGVIKTANAQKKPFSNATLLLDEAID